MNSGRSAEMTSRSAVSASPSRVKSLFCAAVELSTTISLLISMRTLSWVKKSSVFGVLEQIGRFGKRIRRNKYWEIPDLHEKTVVIFRRKGPRSATFTNQLSIY